jgi:hypothetical protein
LGRLYLSSEDFSALSFDFSAFFEVRLFTAVPKTKIPLVFARLIGSSKI